MLSVLVAWGLESDPSRRSAHTQTSQHQHKISRLRVGEGCQVFFQEQAAVFQVTSSELGLGNEADQNQKGLH